MLKTWLSLPGTIKENAALSWHATAETMRWAWRDRLTLLGDPAIESIPVDRLLSDLNAQQSAAAIADAVQQKKILTHDLRSNGQSGTIHISAADDQGNMIALTLTHGNGFGAGVTAAGLGLTLGHGMSRFDPRPDHPNGPRSGKKPLHNMVPVIALEGSQAAFAIGGAGGRKIPNSIFSVLRPWLAENVSLERALTVPRLHTEGTAAMEVTADGSVQKAMLEQLGYTVRTAGSAALVAQPKL
jgi:gamma-glutamyltranspeptidase/glutathione hydrolase